MEADFLSKVEDDVLLPTGAPDEKGFPLLEEEEEDDEGEDFVFRSFFTLATMTEARIFKRESMSDCDEPARGTKQKATNLLKCRT